MSLWRSSLRLTVQGIYEDVRHLRMQAAMLGACPLSAAPMQLGWEAETRVDHRFPRRQACLQWIDSQSIRDPL